MFRILSLDGGGLRGSFGAGFLAALADTNFAVPDPARTPDSADDLVALGERAAKDIGDAVIGRFCSKATATKTESSRTG